MEGRYIVYSIEESASELFVILSKHGYDDIRELRVRQISEFEKLIEEEGKKQGMNICFRSDRYTIPDLLSDHGFIFEEGKIDEARSIKLRDYITPCNLIYEFHDLPYGLVNDELEKKALEMMDLKPSPTPKAFDRATLRFYIEDLEKKLMEELNKEIHDVDFKKCERMRKILITLEDFERICIKYDTEAPEDKSKKYVNTDKISNQ